MCAALAVRDQSLDYVPVEEAAMEARAGMWQGKFIPPGNGAINSGEAGSGRLPQAHLTRGFGGA